jgi:hypothetical protein
MGPAGDCPCLRRQRGQKVEITETFISPSLFALLTDEDKNTVNEIKRKALGLWMAEKHAKKVVND